MSPEPLGLLFVAVLSAILVYLRRSRAPARRRVLETSRIHAVLGAAYVVLTFALVTHAAGDAMVVGFATLGLAFVGLSAGTVGWRAQWMVLALGLDVAAIGLLVMFALGDASGSWHVSRLPHHWAAVFTGLLHLEAIRRSGLELPADTPLVGNDEMPARRTSETLCLTGALYGTGPLALAAGSAALSRWPRPWIDETLFLLDMAPVWGRPGESARTILLGLIASLVAAIAFAIVSRTTSSRPSAMLLGVADLASVALVVAGPLEFWTTGSDPFLLASAAISIALLLASAVGAALSMREER